MIDEGNYNMKKQLERCMYMGIGAFITLISWTLAEMHNASVNAQNAGPLVVDEIVCRKLQVVDEQGNNKVVLSTAFGGGTVIVWDEEGKGAAILNTNNEGGVLSVYGKDKGVVQLSINEYGGLVNVSSKDDNKGGVILGTDLHGGGVAIYNSNAQQVGEFSVHTGGGGWIKTKDKLGNTTGSVP